MPLAVLALLVIGVLVATSFQLGRQELALGRSALRLQEALAAAEAGNDLQLALWDPAARNVLVPGDSVTFGGSLPGGAWYRGSARRLNGPLFLIRSEGFSRDSGARQEVARLVRLDPIEVPRTAAFVTRGPVGVRDLARIAGGDAAPPAWTDCGPPGPGVAGIHTADGAAVSVASCADPACVSGAPGVRADPGLDSAALGTFGDMGFADLRGRATVTVPGGSRLVAPAFIGGMCDALDPDNWGSPTDPGGACGNRFPIVWSEGDLTLAGGEGQGVLIVNGDLALAGAVTFSGAVIVRGRIATQGPGGSVHGVLVALNAGGVEHEVRGNTVLRFSACALERALIRSAMPRPLGSRGWVGVR